MEEKDITVIMPALNEENNIMAAIDNTLAAFADYHIDGEIIVVNDGSSDKTPMLVQEKMSKSPTAQIKLVNHQKPLGIGASFWDGVTEAKGKIVTMFPGDNENDPWEIFRYFKLLEHVDIVIPFIFNREVRPIFRNALSFVYRFIINTTFHVNFNYTNGTVLYRKSVLNELDHRSDSFFFQTDILVRTVKKGYLFAEVPYRLGLRKEGISKAISFSSLRRVMGGYLRLVKDYYFLKKDKGKMNSFTSDSLTAARRNNPQPGQQDNHR